MGAEATLKGQNLDRLESIVTLATNLGPQRNESDLCVLWNSLAAGVGCDRLGQSGAITVDSTSAARYGGLGWAEKYVFLRTWI